MSVFVDTCLFIAARNKRDVNHSRAMELLKEVLEGEGFETILSKEETMRLKERMKAIEESPTPEEARNKALDILRKLYEQHEQLLSILRKLS